MRWRAASLSTLFGTAQSLLLVFASIQFTIYIHNTSIRYQSQDIFFEMSRGGGGGGGVAQLGDDLGDHWKDYGL
jgi:hypothetical protein